MIEVTGISKTFGKALAKNKGKDPAADAGRDATSRMGNAVLKDVDLSIADGEFFCLLGPSGCGKTTLLRIIAGLETPDHGAVKVGGRDVTQAPPHKRGCALVFQNYALWPHLTVGENITYGLEVQARPPEEIRGILAASLMTYQLEGLDARYPHELSGGQQQRVALARAMAIGPHAVLMDEPLSNLDAALRKTLRRELLEFHRSAGSTILYVTHDQEEALALSDRIAVMMDGRIVELGKPADLYARPRTLETALFLGDMNVVQGEKVPGFLRKAGMGTAVAEVNAEGQGARAADAAAMCIRPEKVRVHPVARTAGKADDEGQAAGLAAGQSAGKGGGQGNTQGTYGAGAAANALAGTLAFTEFMGTHANLGVDTSAGRILARMGTEEAAALTAGQALGLEFPAEHLLWY